MKTLIATLIILLLAGCSTLNTDLLSGGENVDGAITLLSGVDLNDAVNRSDLRAGLVIDKLEVGPVYSMYPSKEVKEQWGAYILRELGDESIGVLGQPSIGFQVMFDESFLFLAETTHVLSDVQIRTSIATETYGGKANDWMIRTGPRFEF